MRCVNIGCQEQNSSVELYIQANSANFITPANNHKEVTNLIEDLFEMCEKST